jgi:hypothetical protein
LYEYYEGYERWAIHTYDRRSPETELMHQISIRFSSDGFSCCGDAHELNITYEPTGQPIKVSLQEDPKHLQITLESMVLGTKKSEERANRELYEKVWHKLPWAKQGFKWKNGTWVPIHRFKPLRQKKKKRTIFSL